ncbi:MAG: hypothetical protein KJZ87_21945 [Thermoguttaceae bacterium]|nr:hypothetical protein [Thermoguttaceae bacterium]
MTSTLVTSRQVEACAGGRDELGWFTRSARIVLAMALALVALVFAWRRVAGALVEPLPAPVFLGLTILVLAAAASRRSVHGSRRPVRVVAADVSVSAAAVVLLVSLSLPGTSVAALGLAYLALVVEEAWTWWPAGIQFRRPTVHADTTPQPAATPESPAAPPAPLSSGSSLAVPQENVSQQLARGRTADGREWISGWLRVALAAGQRIAHVHVAFCPPLARAPLARLEPKDAPPMEVRASQVLPFGARFDLKLAQPVEEPLDILLEFRAETDSATEG